MVCETRCMNANERNVNRKPALRSFFAISFHYGMSADMISVHLPEIDPSVRPAGLEILLAVVRGHVRLERSAKRMGLAVDGDVVLTVAS